MSHRSIQTEEMVDEQQRGNASEKFMIVKLPDDINAVPSMLKNLSLPSVIVDSHHVDFESMKMSQTTAKKLPVPEDIGCGSSSVKRRRTDLTCIVCDGQASGYNFNRITCHSCKGKLLPDLLRFISIGEPFSSKNFFVAMRCYPP